MTHSIENLWKTISRLLRKPHIHTELFSIGGGDAEPWRLIPDPNRPPGPKDLCIAHTDSSCAGTPGAPAASVLPTKSLIFTSFRTFTCCHLAHEGVNLDLKFPCWALNPASFRDLVPSTSWELPVFGVLVLRLLLRLAGHQPRSLPSACPGC